MQGDRNDSLPLTLSAVLGRVSHKCPPWFPTSGLAVLAQSMSQLTSYAKHTSCAYIFRCQPLGVSPPSAVSLCSGAQTTGDLLVVRALAGSRAGCLGPHGCWPGSQAPQETPPSFHLFPSLTPATTDQTGAGPAPPLSFSWDGDVFMRLGHKKPHGPLILLYDCFPMNYRRG